MAYNLCMADRTPEELDAKHDAVPIPEENALTVRVRAPISRVGIQQNVGEVIFTQDMKEEYCRLVAETGALARCATAMGVHPRTPLRHRKEDEEFAASVETALSLFRDKIDLAVYHRGVEGWVEAVWFNGVIVGYNRKYSDSMLALFAKRHNPAYRDRFELDANIKQAAVVVTAPASSVEAMQAAAAAVVATTAKGAQDDGSTDRIGD